jgi:hypothetical protein
VDELNQAEATSRQTESTVKQQDADWESRRADLIKNLEDEAKKKTKAAQDSVAADEAALENGTDTARVLQGLKTYFQSHEGDPSAADQAKSFVQRLPSLSDADTTALIAYCDHWAALQSIPTSVPKSDSALRARVQPDHNRLVRELQSQKADLESLQTQVATLKKELQAEYKPENFATTILTGAILILAWIWGIGLAIELFSLGFYLSNDVKQIRSHIETPDVKTVAAAAGIGK